MPYIKTEDGKNVYVDGFINRITLPNGKQYGLQASIIAVKPMQCHKCGGRVVLKYGEGKCEYCGMEYTTKFELVESG